MNKNLRAQVGRTLNLYPDTRNSDGLLILNVYRQHYYLPDPVSQQKLLELFNWANPDHIVRYRRRFNQEGLYLATDPKIIEERAKRKKDMRNNLGYDIPTQKSIISDNQFDTAYNKLFN